MTEALRRLRERLIEMHGRATTVKLAAPPHSESEAEATALERELIASIASLTYAIARAKRLDQLADVERPRP